MSVGIAAALLVFTGIWHATEFLMDGRRQDTVRLIPVGLVYLILGILLVNGAGFVVQIVALVLVATGGGFALLRRREFEIRRWVIWAFVLIDIVIVLALAFALIS